MVKKRTEFRPKATAEILIAIEAMLSQVSFEFSVVISPSASALSIYVIDPHPVFIRGFRALVDDTPEFAWAGASHDPNEGLEAIRRRRPEIVLIDASLAAEMGFRRLSALRLEGLSTRLIILASHAEQDLVFRSLREGLEGFLLKSSHLQELTEAVRQVHQGQQIIDPTATDALLKKIRSEGDHSPVKRLDLLSPQENRVLARVTEGMTNKEIGKHLNLSEKTVKNYLSNVLEKLGMRRRSEAAAFYARHFSNRSA